jgi:DNA sulfur modification protein DndE
MIAEFTQSKIDKQRYRPASDVEDTLDEFRRNLIVGEKYRVGRLAIARSLAEETPVELLPKGTDMGTSIEGHTLFGDESSVWACLIVEASPSIITTIDEFKGLVEAHWTRGARLLQQDLERAEGNTAKFVTTLAALAKQRSSGTFLPTVDEVVDVPQVDGAITIKVGEISENAKNGQPVSITLNAPGISPHISVLGKTRSGKTRTGIVMAEQIAHERPLPLLLIDPKGEFISKGSFVKKSEWQGRTLADRFPGLQAIDVPTQPIPLDFLYRSSRPSPIELAQLAMAFKDSFQKCLRAKGDGALNTLRQAVQDLLTDSNAPISLDDVLNEVQQANQRQGKGSNTIESKLSEMCSLRLFEPKVAPHKFFAGRWAIGLGEATEESRRLVVFLLLDALAKYLLSLPDSNTDPQGNRSLRHLLVIDEAKEILSYKHNALSNLVRKSAAKGGVVMLLSQSPDDFVGEDDDFLSQISSIVVFTSSTNSVKDLRAALGRRLSPEDFSDKNLPTGVALSKLPKHDLMKVVAWK